MAGWGNSYALLDEDESGEGIVRLPPKAVAPAAKEEPKAAHKNAPATDKKEGGRKPEGRKPEGRTGGQGERRAPRAREERDADSNAVDPQQPASGGNTTGVVPSTDRGHFRQRGSGERGAGERRARVEGQHSETTGATRTRQYDRRSGTGRGREEKRGGAGRGNWGSDDQEIQEATQQAEADAAAPIADGEWGVPAGGADWAAKKAEGNDAEGEAAEGGEQAEKQAERAPRELTEEEKQRQAEREKEAKLMTLDEYFKSKKQLDIALPPARKAGEGEDDKQWASFVAAKSEKTDDDAKAKQAEAKKSEEKKKDNKNVSAELLRFKSGEQQRERREREDFGNRRPRGGDYANNNSERPPRRDRDSAPREPRAAAPASNKAAAAKTAEFNNNDFPALKV